MHKAHKCGLFVNNKIHLCLTKSNQVASQDFECSACGSLLHTYICHFWSSTALGAPFQLDFEKITRTVFKNSPFVL